MTENTRPESQTASPLPFDRWLQRFYRLGVALLAIFVLISALVFVGRAAIYKIHAYERGLHLRGGRFVRVQEPGWHLQNRYHPIQRDQFDNLLDELSFPG